MKLDAAIRAFLEAPRYAVLATVNTDGSPHVTELWYGLRGDEPIFNTAAGRSKPLNLERDPRVSLLVGPTKGDRVWGSSGRTPEPGEQAYVRLDGTAREVASGAQAIADLRELATRYENASDADRRIRAVAASTQARLTYAIAVRRIYRHDV